MSSQDIQSINKDDSFVLPRLGKNSPTLSYFCVYNPSLGQSEENTKDQILYYTAKKVVPADVKMKQIGLAQALVNFTSTFSPSHPTQNVHSQKNRMIFLQPEPGFWIHMCVELGVSRKQIKDSKGKEKLVTEYLDSQLNDKALEAVLKIGYEQFKLLNGTFTYLLFGDSVEKPTRQRTRALMHAIEEFFSEWIWKWDFDRLDTMCFTAVFNGVPVQPVLRNNYLRVNELDKAVQAKFENHISHLFVLNLEDGGLVYRSPTLLINDVCSLRKYVLKKVEKYLKKEKAKLDIESSLKKEVKPSGLKAFTKSISTSQILNYFSVGSKSTDTVASSTPASISTEDSTNSGLPAISDIPTEPTSPDGSSVTDMTGQGIFLTGLIEKMAIGMNGEERPVTRSELIRVHISSDKNGEQNDTLLQYYLLIYKHKSNLVWSYLLPATSKSEDLISDPLFYIELENYMGEKKLDQLTDVLNENITSMQEKSLNLGKNYKCFYYDNTTLNIKSTMIDPPSLAKSPKDKKTTIQVTNDMILQLLEVREDFEKIPHTSEVYTRSTANHWIAGHRLYNTLRSTEEEDLDTAIHENRSSLDEFSRDEDMDDFTEMYLIAAKKDTSLADVEETLGKMTTSLLDTMHIE
ncbi:hypothetical protein INT47_007793 [Mucor saturninus]|uniref:CCZ1/INTU/HSP4 first Longin domain-containing protein n=1 Tax=Mucor saturninus TaxID=64648 RepID=A0A8H7RC79_9FUNG|nr:hypothetical protein INT47_007793 [Mucor saturninus]